MHIKIDNPDNLKLGNHLIPEHTRFQKRIPQRFNQIAKCLRMMSEQCEQAGYLRHLNHPCRHFISGYFSENVDSSVGLFLKIQTRLP
ncbi:hypothetical protein D3C80_1929930 [compost metagenome]